MSENTKSQILKPGRIVGVLTILLLLVCIAVKGLAMMWEGSQSGVLAATLYSKLLFMAVILAFFGYYRTGAIGKNVGAVMFLMITIPFFLLNFIVSPSSRGVGILAIMGFMLLMPLFLTVLALIEKEVQFWKRLVPLAIPVCLVFSMLLANNVGGFFVLIAIGLVAVVALIGKR